MSDGMSSFVAGRKDIAEGPARCMVRYRVFSGANSMYSRIWTENVKVDYCECDDREVLGETRPPDDYYWDDLESLSVRLKKS